MFDKNSGKRIWVAVLLVMVLIVVSFTACDLAQPKKTAPAPVPNNMPAPAPLETVTYPVEGIVSDVVDNNIIEIKNGDKKYPVRYIGIYMLVPFQYRKPLSYYADEGYKKNYELASDRTVRLERDVSETDKAGHLLRYVWLGEIMLNAEMVRQGYAMAMGSPPDIKYADLLRKMQKEAEDARRGLWEEETQQTPLSPVLGTFVGSTATKVYHYASCSLVSKIIEENRITFMTANTALARGYKSCTTCKTQAAVCEQE